MSLIVEKARGERLEKYQQEVKIVRSHHNKRFTISNKSHNHLFFEHRILVTEAVLEELSM